MQGTGRGSHSGLHFVQSVETAVHLKPQRQWRWEGQGQVAQRLWERKKKGAWSRRFPSWLNAVSLPRPEDNVPSHSGEGKLEAPRGLSETPHGWVMVARKGRLCHPEAEV